MNYPIRILQIVNYMDRGGIETMLMNYYRNIDKSKVQFDFLTHKHGEFAYNEEIRTLGGKIYLLPNLNPFSADYFKKLDEFFSEHKEYNIVHCHYDCMSAYPLYFAKKHNVKVRIAHAHSTNQTKDIKLPIKLVSKKFINSVATDLCACSKEAGKWMFCKDNFNVITNAISTDKFRFNQEVRNKVRKELNLNDCFVIGITANYSEVKNHCFLLNVLSELLKNDSKFKLLFIGKGSCQENIDKTINELELNDNVIQLGVRSDVDELVQAMDVFALPSKYEGFSVSLLEAQASGLPCVVSDRVPKESAVTNNVQWLSIDNGVEEWVKAFLKLKNFEREDTYEQIIKAKFDIKESAKNLTDFYFDLLNRE